MSFVITCPCQTSKSRYQEYMANVALVAITRYNYSVLDRLPEVFNRWLQSLFTFRQATRSIYAGLWSLHWPVYRMNTNTCLKCGWKICTSNPGPSNTSSQQHSLLGDHRPVCQPRQLLLDRISLTWISYARRVPRWQMGGLVQWSHNSTHQHQRWRRLFILAFAKFTRPTVDLKINNFLLWKASWF